MLDPGEPHSGNSVRGHNMLMDPQLAESSSRSSDEDSESEWDDTVMEQLVFVPVAGPSQGSQDQVAEGSSTGRTRVQKRRTSVALDDDEDNRVVDVDNDAAREYGEGETMQEAWRKHFTEAKHKDGVGGSAGKSIAHCTHLSLIAFSSLSVADSATDRALWELFDSEMDCDVASWCIKEGVSEGAVNRLLNIRNVSRCVVLPHSGRTHKHI